MRSECKCIGQTTLIAVQVFIYLYNIVAISISAFCIKVRLSYPVGTGGSFPWGRVAGAWSWQLTSI